MEGVKNVDLVTIFGLNVRKYRLQIGVSQEKFAEMCDLHRTYISDIERFQRSISLKNIQKIATALNVDPYVLLMEEKNDKN